MNREKKPLISIIIVNHNGAAFILNCIDSIFSANYRNFELIFVDNNSTDNSLKLVENRFGSNQRLKVVIFLNNLGFAEGNNQGASEAKGRYLFFLNIDTKVNPNYLTELVKIIESDPNIGAAQSKLLQMDKPAILDSAGDIMNCFCGTFNRGFGEKDEGQYDRVEQIFSARGAAMMVRKDVFRKVGGFDQRFFLGLEDVDLCWRIRLNGYKIVFVPRSVVYHKGRAFTRKYPGELVFHGEKNRIYMLLKNYSLSNIFKYLPVVILIELHDAFIFLCQKEFVKSFNVTKALLWNLIRLERIMQERLKVQRSLRKIPDKAIMPFIFKGFHADIKRYLFKTSV